MSGATVERIPLHKFAEFPIRLPPIEQQREIASILSAYDDLIENNTRRIAVLEKMAQRIYEEWFVHLRAPGCKIIHCIDTPLGPVPEGWEAIKLGEIALVQWGDTRTTKSSYMASGFDAYSAAGMDGSLDHFDFDRSGIVVSAIGANCGQTWLAYGKWSCIKNTIKMWSTNSDICDEYLYLTTYGIKFWPRRGAAQPFISQSDARSILVLKPPNVTSRAFANIVRPVFGLRHNLLKHNRNLRSQRDLLLPKLISGEISVSRALAYLEAAE